MKIPTALIWLAVLTGCSDSISIPNEHDRAAFPSLSPNGVPDRAGDWGSKWTAISDSALWHYIASRDSVLVVGIKPPGANRGVWRGDIFTTRAEKLTAVATAKSTSAVNVVSMDTLLPVMRVKVMSEQAVRAVRRMPFVDYAEPNAIVVRYASASGCTYESASASPLFTFAGDQLPPLYKHGIEMAWNRTRGDGVVLGLVDTGISASQDHLNSRFAEGHSTGRQQFYRGIDEHPWYETSCSHGNRMAGTMAAPMNGSSIVGVAWRSHLVSAHQGNTVWGIDTGDAIDGVRAAATDLQAQFPNRRIVTMAFEADDPFHSLADEIRYWHARGRLFIGASGSIDYAGIAWPAEMAEVVAVSAVSSTGGELSGINYGDDVELSFFEGQLTHGRNTHELANLGLTSGATAVVAGIAALVWSYYPLESNEQIRQRLRGGSSSRDRVRGFGIPNAMQIVGGLYGVFIQVDTVEATSGYVVYDLTATPRGGEGPYSYSWSTGQTGQTIRTTIYDWEQPSRTLVASISEPDPMGTSVAWSQMIIHGPRPPCADPSQINC